MKTEIVIRFDDDGWYAAHVVHDGKIYKCGRFLNLPHARKVAERWVAMFVPRAHAS